MPLFLLGLFCFLLVLGFLWGKEPLSFALISLVVIAAIGFAGFILMIGWALLSDGGGDAGGVIIAAVVIFGVVKAFSLGGQEKVEEVKKKEVPVNNAHKKSPPVLDNPSLYESRHGSRAERYDEPDEEITELMENHDLDQDEAENVQRIMDEEGLDEDDAVALKDEL